MSLLRRLRERKLVQWALAYLTGAWVVIEVFDLFDGRFGWPSWSFTALLSLVVVGFPITLVLAWYHGERGRQRVSGPELVIIATLLTVTGVLIPRVWPDRQAIGTEPRAGADGVPIDAAQGRPTLAVLPFANLGGHPEDESFAEGIHAEVLTQLFKISSIDTKSQTSVFAYRDASRDLPTIGRELGVAYILEAGIQRVGETIRMRVDLFDAASDRRIWGDVYERRRTVESLLDLQRGIALEVATRVGAEVLPAERSELVVDAPENLAAYERYLDGLADLRAVQLRADGWKVAADRGIERLHEAITAEPDWVPPRAALGRLHHFVATGTSGEEARAHFRSSRAALDAALERDSLYAPAWSSLGFVRHTWELDFSGAEAAYRKAQELGQRPVWSYAYLLLSWGRFDEAVPLFEEALSFDPLSTTIPLQLGWAQTCAGDYASAIERLEAALEVQDRGVTHAFLAYAYIKSGHRDRSFAEAGRLGWAEVDALVYALADSARRAEESLATAERDRGGFAFGFLPAAAIVLGQRDQALGYLERSVEEDPRALLFVRCLEEVRSLEGDPRYERVLDRVGFPR